MKLKELKLNRIDYKPLFLTLAIIVSDQIIKLIVVKKIPVWTYPTSPNRIRVLGDFLCFIHVRNLGAGFSLGADYTGFLRVMLMFVIPTLVMIVVCYAVIGGREKFKFTKTEVYFLATILGGGVGTLIDRFFRRDGVVDFISIKLYGFLGMQYWPTFNISDLSVVIGVLGMLISFTISEFSKKKVGN